VVAVCFKGNEDLSRWMVSNGWAVSFRRYSVDYVAEDAARQSHVNIHFDMPWEWRAEQRNREVSWLLAFENAPGLETGQTVRVRKAASVAHQTAGGGELAQKIDCWNAVAEGECAELRGVAAEQRILPITSAATRNCAAVAKAASKSASALAWST